MAQRGSPATPRLGSSLTPAVGYIRLPGDAVLEAGSPRSKGRQGPVASEDAREKSVPGLTRHPPRVPICVQISPSYQDTSHGGFRAHPAPVWPQTISLYLQRPHFPIRSPSVVLRVRDSGSCSTHSTQVVRPKVLITIPHTTTGRAHRLVLRNTPRPQPPNTNKWANTRTRLANTEGHRPAKGICPYPVSAGR